MSTPMTITLRIHRFCGCEECLPKVQSALLKIGEILQQDVVRGDFTLSTFKPPEKVVSILHSKLKKNIAILSTEEINGPDPVQGTRINSNLFVNIGAHGCGSVEVTQSTTVRSKIAHSNRRRNNQAHGETSDPPPPPPRTYKPPPPPPPKPFFEPQPPRTYETQPPQKPFFEPQPPPNPLFEPSAPPMPESEYEDYGFRYESRGSATASMNDQGSFVIAFIYLVIFMMIYICLNLDGRRA